MKVPLSWIREFVDVKATAEEIGTLMGVRGLALEGLEKWPALSEQGESKGAIEYGPESPMTIAWDDAAAARMKKIPAFVRGMVVKAVEDSCRKSGLDRVTVEELERIRARMPTPKFFG